MAVIPKSNLNGLPQITAADLKSNDPSRLNRTIRLLASQIQSLQTGKASSTGITNATTIINETSGGGSGGGGGGGGSTPTTEIVTLQGTHAQRLSTYPAASEPVGVLFYETDRTVTYLDYASPAGPLVWQYMTGVMMAAFASRPTDLGASDSGFQFYATDQELAYLWNGAAWEFFPNIEPILQDTYANWTSTNYPPATYDAGIMFVITNWNVIYTVQVVSSTNKWVYATGVYINTAANRPTTGYNGAALGTNDKGLVFVASDTEIAQFWTGSAWTQFPSVPASATVLASNSSHQVIAATLASGDIWQGNGSNLPAAVAVPASALVVATNSSSQLTAAALASGSIWEGNGSNLPAVQSLGQIGIGGAANPSNAGAAIGTASNALSLYASGNKFTESTTPNQVSDTGTGSASGAIVAGALNDINSVGVPLVNGLRIELFLTTYHFLVSTGNTLVFNGSSAEPVYSAGSTGAGTVALAYGAGAGGTGETVITLIYFSGVGWIIQD